MTLKLTAALAVLTAAAATSATAQVAVAGWSKTPTSAEIAAAYPPRAKAAGVGGMVLLSCTLTRAMQPRDCTATHEEPDNLGFGTAARKVAETYLVAAPQENLVKGSEVEIPVAFPVELVRGGQFVVRNPTWVEIPATSDFQAAFPKAENGVNNVRVAYTCTAQDGGALADCTLDREEPAGQGYGQAAAVLMPKFRVGAWSVDGQPTYGAKVRVPIRYELKQVQAAAR